MFERNKDRMENHTYIFIFLTALLLAPATGCRAMAALTDSLRRTTVGTEKKDWEMLREKVAADSHVPDRTEVLQLIDYHRDAPARCEKLLRRLNGGKAYRYIVAYILPVLSIPVRKPLPALSAREATPIYIKAGSDLPRRISAEAAGEQEPKQPVRARRTLLAVKNNLLYDLALAPNLELEVPLGKRWSVNAEYKCPWWASEAKKRCYQLLSGGVEGRYWPGNRRHRRPLTGHFLGVYAEGGRYDFQFHVEGCQGDYYVASGLTYGYAKQIARHFSLEFSLGIGYLATSYRRYVSFRESLVRTDTGSYRGVMPTKAKISLVWLLTSGR